MIEFERPPIIETAVLVRLVLPDEPSHEVEESLEEMRRLAETAGADVRRVVVQSRPKPCPATHIGAGKVEELTAVCQEAEADVVLFDSDLSPTQAGKLEERLGVKVLDRTQLILDIFAQHAYTNEGKHQVELAQLQYLLPRLAGRGAIMRQQGGIGVRGPGEQKLEVDRRRIRRRIDHLTATLDSVRNHRRVQRKRRVEDAAGTVALVGYTNAGKSSLLNALTRAGVLVADKLFATLDPRSRRCTLPSGRACVLSDTVGLIRRLPHTLVAAFRATLEEISEADLLLLVADAAHPAVEDHVRAVRAVLDEIGAAERPILSVFNKVDIAPPAVAERLRREARDAVAVSARTGAGLDALLERIDASLAGAWRRVRIHIPHAEAALAARVHADGRVLAREDGPDGILLDAEVSAMLEQQLAGYIS